MRFALQYKCLLRILQNRTYNINIYIRVSPQIRFAVKKKKEKALKNSYNCL